MKPFTTLTLPLEFMTWFLWLVVFAVIQYELCKQYPGIKTVCRTIFLITALVAVVPGVWTLATRFHDHHLLTMLNHTFGMGVFAQTSLRAILQLRWLGWAGFQQPVDKPLDIRQTEVQLVGLLIGLTGAMRGIEPEAIESDEA